MSLKIIIFLFSFSIGFLFVVHAQAATYYVDFDVGDDTNIGISTGTAWKHSPGDSNATNNANIALSAGDVIVFKGGIQYNGQINVNASGGSDSNRITFISGHLHNSVWPDIFSQAIIDGQLARKFGFYVNGKSYITIKGFEIRNIGAPTTDAAGIDFENAGGAANYNIVEYNTIHDINWGGNYVRGYGIENNHGSNHIYRYNTIYNATDKLIEIYGGGNSPLAGNNANNNDIHYNVLKNAGVHAVVLSGDNNIFYKNIIIESQYVNGYPSPGFGLKVDEGSYNLVYNNILINIGAGLGVLCGYQNKFYNNTLYGVGNGVGGTYGGGVEAGIVLINDGACTDWSNQYAVVGNEFKNNIIHYVKNVNTASQPKPIYFKDDAGVNNIISYNSIYSASGDNVNTGIRIRRKLSGIYYYSNIADFEANFNAWEGGSGNVAANNRSVDTGFNGGSLITIADLPTGYNSLWSAPNGGGLSLLSNADVINNGALIIGFTTDIIGTTRPQGSSWDIGAYEYVEAAPPPDTTPSAAPTGLTVN